MDQHKTKKKGFFEKITSFNFKKLFKEEKEELLSLDREDHEQNKRIGLKESLEELESNPHLIYEYKKTQADAFNDYLDRERGKLAIEELLTEEEKHLIKTSPTYKRVSENHQEKLWQELEGKTVGDVVEPWLNSIRNERTKRSYKTSLNELVKKGHLNPSQSLQRFSLQNHNVTVDQIKADQESIWSEATKQMRAAAFISFTGFLERRTSGIIKKAIPCKEGNERTFHRVRSHVKTKSLENQKMASAFFKELAEINKRDCLIAKILLQGGKRISEVLSLETSWIDFNQNEITFKQSKTKGTDQFTVISFKSEFLEELRGYIGDREGLVFITSTGKKVAPQQIERNFKVAGERAKIPFKMTPHVLRTTAVTLYKKNGYSDSDVMKVTGHADSEMVRMYDKSSLSDNASKKISLI